MGRRSRADQALSVYRIGARVRKLRLRKKISLEELGRHTSLSPALLSKLERGLVTPTLPTLTRIAAVFSIGLGEFFAHDAPSATVVRAAEHMRFRERQDVDDPAYDFIALNFNADGRTLNGYLAEFHEQPGTLRLHTHDAAEFLHLLSGELLVRVEGCDHRLGVGDSIDIRSGAAHGYARIGVQRCRAIVVTTAHPAAAVDVK